MKKQTGPKVRLSYIEKEERLLALDKITKEDLKILSPKELSRFQVKCNLLLNSSTDVDKDIFFKKFDLFISKEQKNMIWEQNHHNITQEIHRFLEQYKMLPSKNHLMNATHLSRSTIETHLTEFATNSFHKNYLNQMEFMAHKVLSKLLTSALQGDVKASRLFLEAIGHFKRDHPNTTYIKNQNNFLQINNTILTEESLNKLPRQKLIQIEELIKAND